MELPVLVEVVPVSGPKAVPRRALGLVLVFLLLMGGRYIRQTILLDDEGQWRDHLWLDELVLPSTAQAGLVGGKRPKIKLTAPLPINTCSQDSLTLLPGVGKVMAQRIFEARQQGLVFSCAKDLQTIKGIGEKLSARLDTMVYYCTTLPNEVQSADSSQSSSAKKIP